MGPREENYWRKNKLAFRIMFAGAASGAAIAYTVLIPMMLRGQLPELGWGFVLGAPVGMYGLVIFGSLWAISLDLKGLRKLDAADAAE